MPQADANGNSFHYRFDGPESGPVVILSNSLATDHTMWDAQMPALVGAGYRVLRYDTRGHGRSGVTPGPYTIELLSEDVLRLLDTFGLERVHFCGISLGGMVGQMLGVRHADRVRSLALCDTAAYTGGPAIWEERMRAVRESGMAAVLEPTVERWISAAGRARLPEAVEHIRAMILGTPVEGYCGCAEAIGAMDQRESIRAIATPTLVVVGELDTGTTVDMARQIEERIAGARLVVLPEAAHLANIEQAEAFNRALLDFLQSQGE